MPIEETVETPTPKGTQQGETEPTSLWDLPISELSLMVGNMNTFIENSRKAGYSEDKIRPLEEARDNVETTMWTRKIHLAIEEELDRQQREKPGEGKPFKGISNPELTALSTHADRLARATNEHPSSSDEEKVYFQRVSLMLRIGKSKRKL